MDYREALIKDLECWSGLGIEPETSRAVVQHSLPTELTAGRR